jgi:mannose-6-phosphate isomerase-like protein (cupin superfamily)
MSLGIYRLAAGQQDPQRPHQEDEVYYVIEGQGMIHVAGDEQKVEAGDLVFVAAGDVHYFHEIVKDLTLLVFFAPAETPQNK